VTRIRPLFPLTIAVLLAACGDEPAGDGQVTSGEVVQGTVSDAMLPLDAVRSQPPLAEPEAAARVQARADADAATTAPEGEATEASGDEADAAATEAEEPAEPAAE